MTDTSNTQVLVETVPEIGDITISRFELYPKDHPTCYCVGFTVTCRDTHMYKDTQVPLDIAQTCQCDMEIAQHAYDALKDTIDAWIETVSQRPRILGSTFVPPGQEPSNVETLPDVIVDPTMDDLMF